MTSPQCRDHLCPELRLSGLRSIQIHADLIPGFLWKWDSYRYGAGQVLGQPGILEADISSTKTWELPGWTKTTQKNLKEPQSFLINWYLFFPFGGFLQATRSWNPCGGWAGPLPSACHPVAICCVWCEGSRHARVEVMSKEYDQMYLKSFFGGGTQLSNHSKPPCNPHVL